MMLSDVCLSDNFVAYIGWRTERLGLQEH